MTPTTETAPIEIVDSMDAVEFDVDRGLFRATFDTDRDVLSLAVIAVVATVTNRDPTDVAPLNANIDTDALNAVFSMTPSGVQRSGRISFEYEGFSVTLFSEGTIEAEPVASR